jgi:hypothetical protein
MTKLQGLGASLLALTISFGATIASAQSLPTPPLSGGSPPPAQTGTAPQGAAPATTDRYAMVVRSEWDGSYRSPRQGDRDLGVVSLDDFMKVCTKKAPDGSCKAYQTEADFNRVTEDNNGVCRETGSFVRESIAIMGEAGKIDADLVDIADELAALGAAQNKASWARRGFSVVSGLFLCALSPGKYCKAAVAGLIGSEIGSSAHDKAMRLNRRASDVNVTQSRLQLRATLLTMRMNIGWSKMVHGYCVQYLPDSTLGNTPVS